MLLLRKASLWGCYKPRHVTKWDVILLATIRYLKNKQKIVHELVTSMSKRSMFQYFFWTTKRKADVTGFRQGAKKNGIAHTVVQRKSYHRYCTYGFIVFYHQPSELKMNVICSWMQCSDLRMRYCCVFVMFAPRQVYLGVTGRQKRDVIRAAHRAETDHGGWRVIKYDISSF